MVLRGLMIATAGFIFIFSPGIPIGLLNRRSPSFKRELIYWGIGLWLLALLPSLFLQSLLRQLLIGSQAPRALTGQPMDYLLTLGGAFLSALLVQGAMVLVLLRQREESQSLPANGMAIGFGVGLIAQVFTGLGLVAAGFRLMYGMTSTPTLALLAGASFLELSIGLLPLLLYRPALLAVSAVQGVLAARTINGGWVHFWQGILVSTFFAWTIVAIQLLLRSESPGQVLLGITDPRISAVTLVYYILAFALAFRWLLARIGDWRQTS